MLKMPPPLHRRRPLKAPAICKGIIAKTGNPCRFKAKDGSEYCGRHQEQAKSAPQPAVEDVDVLAKYVKAKPKKPLPPPSPITAGECDAMIAKSVKGEPICEEIRECAASVKGAAKNSASPTDIWFVRPKDGDVGVMVMKIYVSPSTAETVPSMMRGDTLDRILALDYERRIYSEVIKPLIATKRCKNFIFSLGEGVDCTFESLLALLENSTVPASIRSDVLHRNIFMMRRSKRPAIDDTKGLMKIPTSVKRENESFLYNYTLMTAAPTNSVVFADVNNVEGPKPISRFLWDILFQVYFAIYALNLSKVSHQDLHEGNIFVRRIPPTRKTYCINNKLLTTVTTAEAFIYDFDRAYCERFGENAYIAFDVLSQKNIFTEKWDVIKPLTYIYDSKTKGLRRSAFATLKNNKFPDSNSSWKQIMDLFVKNGDNYEQNADYMHQIFTNGYFLEHPKDAEETVRTELGDSAFNTPLEVLMILATIVGVETTAEDAAGEKDGILNASEFSANGAIRVARPSTPTALTGRNVIPIIPRRSAHVAARENYMR
jgi:hypothetical protein